MDKRVDRCTLQPSVFVAVGLVQSLCTSSNGARLKPASQYASVSLYLCRGGLLRCELCTVTAFDAPSSWCYVDLSLVVPAFGALSTWTKRWTTAPCETSSLSFSDNFLTCGTSDVGGKKCAAYLRGTLH